VAVFDNHIHLRASFKGVEAAKLFERAGGTAMLLTHSRTQKRPSPELMTTLRHMA